MYLGNQPALSYTSFAKQDFTTSATTSYTLDQPVANENEIALFINFVRQEPTTAYTASGTTLTLTSATSASDDMYCVFLGKAVQTVNPPNGSVGTAQLASTAVTPAKMDLSQDYTFTGKISGQNYPAFEAYLGSSQTVTDNITTKIQFNTEVFDTDGCYDNVTNYRFTPTVAGKYFVYAKLSSDTIAGANLDQLDMRIRKNGSTLSMVKLDARGNTLGNWCTVNDATIVDMNGTTDYLEVFGTIDDTSGNPDFYNGDRSTNFGAYRIGD